MPDDSLGFAVSRLQRHSAELGEADVPPADAEDARRVLLSDGAVLVRDGSALHDAGAAIEDPAPAIGTKQFVGVGQIAQHLLRLTDFSVHHVWVG